MTDAQPIRTENTVKRWFTPIKIAAAIVFLLFVVGGPAEQLLLGWLYFPLRIAPLISPDWPTAILGVVCVVGFVPLLHSTICWFLKATNLTRRSRSEWSFKSTFVVSAILLLMFVAGTAMVGITHQTIWLCSGRGGDAQDEEAYKQRNIGSLTIAVFRARAEAQKTMARYNLKHLGLAFHNTVDDFRVLPPGGAITEDGRLMHGWAMFIQSYTGYYDAGKTNYRIPWQQPPNDFVYKCELQDFVNPCQSGPLFDEQGYGLSHVAGNIHVMPILTLDRDFESDEQSSPRRWMDQFKKKGLAIGLDKITDGTSNTILLGTVGDRWKPWGHPANVRDPALGINRSPEGFGGPEDWKGAMFAMCDGSVKFIDQKIDLKVMQALGTPAGGETLTDSDLRYLK